MAGEGEGSAGRGAALERAYVHEVYEQVGTAGAVGTTGTSGTSGSTGPGGAPDADGEGESRAVAAFLRDLEPGSLVCDVGCGNGRNLGVQPDVFTLGGDRCIRLATHAHSNNNEVVVCDNLCLPFKDECFDGVVSASVVHHFATVERRARALRELARVTRIGGRLLVTVWAMEHEGRNFQSQDVLIPWHRPVSLCPHTPLPPRRAFLSVDNDRNLEPWKNREGSPGSSSLSSPNETCYSFVRKALQKLAGRRSFLTSWGIRNGPGVSILPEPLAGDLPIELRRLDDPNTVLLQGQLTSSLDIPAPPSPTTTKSRSLTNIADLDKGLLIKSRSSLPSLVNEKPVSECNESILISENQPRKKPKLVKQKKSINEDDAEEDLDKPTDMRSLVEGLPNFKVTTNRLEKRPGVFKQSSLNEELMSTERLREKEKLRKNIQKQASLNEEYLFRRPGALDSIRDSIFLTSATTAKKFQSLKNGLTNKFKTNNMEKVTVIGFVRMLQGWKSLACEVPTTPSETSCNVERGCHERRHSKEDGSDSSKDSSLQSDTSVDSEDSFASVIYVPKADGSTSDPLSPTPLSPGPTSPRLKVPSVPTSPRMKTSPGLPSPRLKQVFPIIRPPVSPKSSVAPVQLNKILVAQYSLQNQYKPNQSVHVEPQSKSQPNSPPKSLTCDSPFSMKDITPEVTEAVFIPTIKQEEEVLTKDVAPLTSGEIITQISRDIHKLTADTTAFKPRILQDVKPYPKITLQTVAEIPECQTGKSDESPSPPPTETMDNLEPRSSEKKRKDRLKQIREMLNKGFPAPSGRGVFPIVRRQVGKAEPIAKSHPKLLSLELFNPAVDDVDSDSSGVSSPDSVDSVISVVPDELKKIAAEKDQPNPSTRTKEETAEEKPELQTLVKAAADVAHSLDETCETVIQSSPQSKIKLLDKLDSSDALAIVQGASSSSSSSNWSLNKLSPGDLKILDDKSRSQSHTSSSGSLSSLERLSPGRRSKERSPKQSSTSNSTWSLNRLSPNRPEGRSLEENIGKCHKSPTKYLYDSLSLSSTDSDKSISKSESFSRLQANEKLVTCKSDQISIDEPDLEWNDGSKQHLTEFAEKLTEKLLHEIDQYSKRLSEEDFDLPSSSGSEKSLSMKLKREEEAKNTQKVLDDLSDSLQHLHDPYISKLSSDIQDLSKLTAEIHQRNKYIASLSDSQETDINRLFPKCGTVGQSKKRTKTGLDPVIMKYKELKKSMKVTSEEDLNLNNCNIVQYDPSRTIPEDDKSHDDSSKTDEDSAISSSYGNPEITIDSGAYDISQSLETGYSIESEMSIDSLCTDKRSSLKVGQSTDSSDLDKMEISPESITSRSSAPLKSGFSVESSDISAGSDWSRRDKTGSTASLGCGSIASLPSCSECSKERRLLATRSSSEEVSAAGPSVRSAAHAPLQSSLSDGSDSLPSEGGAVTYHRYYHVFRKGELDQLIENYVESLHVVSSYYDQASWCVVAEKVQVWTI